MRPRPSLCPIQTVSRGPAAENDVASRLQDGACVEAPGAAKKSKAHVRG